MSIFLSSYPHIKVRVTLFNFLHLHFQMPLFVITIWMKFVMYCPVQFINDANDVLECASWACIIKGKERKPVKCVTVIYYMMKQLVKLYINTSNKWWFFEIIRRSNTIGHGKIYSSDMIMIMPDRVWSPLLLFEKYLVLKK